MVEFFNKILKSWGYLFKSKKYSLLILLIVLLLGNLLLGKVIYDNLSSGRNQKGSVKGTYIQSESKKEKESLDLSQNQSDKVKEPVVSTKTEESTPESIPSPVDACVGNTNCGECGNPECVVEQPTYIPTPEPTPDPEPDPVPEPATTYTTYSCSNPQFESEVIAELNRVRSDNGSGSVYLDGALSLASCNHSGWMSATGSGLSHSGENGSQPWDRCAYFGSYCSGEILATGYSSGSAVVAAWMGSDVHRNIILTEGYSAAGVALSGEYITVDFR